MSGVDRDHPGFVARADQFVAGVADKVAEHGVEVIGVFPTQDERGLPFAYTVGLTVVDCAELVLVGPGLDVAHGILNDLARRVLDRRRPAYEWNERLVDPFGTGFDLATLVDVDALDWTGARFPPNLARRLYGPGATFLQVVWQDDGHRWPWEDGFDAGGGELPLLGPVPTWAQT